jgi:hypothetical protein
VLSQFSASSQRIDLGKEERAKMKIAIQGQDYTAALDAAHPLTIERKLNTPSVCQLWLSLANNGSLAAPLRNQYLTVVGDDGTIYFTGYIAVSPLPEFAGLGIEGPRYRIAIQAISDELLLDQLRMPSIGGVAGQTASGLIASLVVHSGSSAIDTQGVSLSAPIGSFIPEPGASWSKSAGQVATQARAAYRVINGALSLASVQSTVHPLNETDGTLNLASLALSASVKRALANDVTVCGEHEPVAYVTEYFEGDGVTTQFSLASEPFFQTSAKTSLVRELFNEAFINDALWSNLSSSGSISLGASGLSIEGGNGIDGETVLSWIDPIEMGGTLLLEAVGVNLSLGSTGVLAGFFTGTNRQLDCTAGFHVMAAQGTGAVSVQPLIQGYPAGSSYALSAANQYTLRLRVHCPEMERELQVYRTLGDNGAITLGGQSNQAPAKVQMEIQPFVDGVAGMPVTLYDGALAEIPFTCTLVAASSLNLIGTMRSLNLTDLGSGWVVSAPATGGAYTRRIGTTAEAAECEVQRTGKLVFYAGFQPAVGEQAAVSYRTVGRSVGRAVNAASQQALAQAGEPAVAAWIGTVTQPAPRSSADCRNAASAMEQAAAGVAALWSGRYKGTRNSFAADVWPGDALQLKAPSTNLNAQVVVRSVKVSYRASLPDLVEYGIEFANDWADDLAIKTSETVPVDAWLAAPVSPTFLANLSGLTVTALNGSSITINTGVTPPAGGGFEIRRRDFAFMPGQDPDLVARATVPNVTFFRETANDRFYIRMYDGSTPPNYSEFSTALFINLPLGS